MSKHTAEDHAKIEFEKFEVRRREFKESLGEAETIKQLEEAAKMIGDSKPKDRKRRK